MDEKTFTTTIKSASWEMTKRERVKFSDNRGSIKLDEVVTNDGIELNVVNYVELAIHNGYSKDRQDYANYVLICDDGTTYVTGSPSFWSAFKPIYDELEGEDVTIKVVKKASKNYTGKSFLSCYLI